MNYTIITLCALLSVTGLSAQKVDKTKIDYEVEMLPLELISKEKKFDIFIEYDYAARTEAAHAEVEEKKAAAAQEKEDYEKKSFGEKLGRKALLGESKPSGKFNNKDFIPTMFPAEGVKGAINIPGYTKMTGAKGSIHVMFFELSFSIDQTNTKISYYPLKMVLTATNDKGEVVFQGEVPNNSSSLTYTATTAGGAASLSAIRSCETDAKNQAIKNLNAYLKTNYGYNMMKDERAFFDVKDKKMTYTEHHEAFEKIKIAFMFCNMPAKKAEMENNLRAAITLWEKSLQEYDKTNKDARVNADIAAATYLNIAEAYIWLHEFDKAMDALASYKMTGEDYNRTYNDKSEFMKDFSARYNKYATY